MCGDDGIMAHGGRGGLERDAPDVYECVIPGCLLQYLQAWGPWMSCLPSSQ